MSGHDFMFKLLIVGESGVGKTCMLVRFSDNVFDADCLSTIGVDFKVKQIEVDGQRVKLQIWDSAGQERFRNITSSYYRNCSGIIIVYDVTKLESFNKVTEWIAEVHRFVPSVPLMVVGNKCDLEDRQVSTEDGKQLAERQGLIFLETSAKTNVNIEEAFQELSKKLIEVEATKPPSGPTPVKALALDKAQLGEKKKKKGLCK
jgi:small GTP-binding protein